MNCFEKTIRWLHRTEDSARILTIGSMTGIIFSQVIGRAMFNWSSPSLEEAARFLMIWSIFFGAVVTTRVDGHIRMEGFFRSGKGKLWFELFSKVFILIFLFVFVWSSAEYASHSIRKGMVSYVLQMPLIVVHVSFLVGSVLMALHTLLHLIKRIRELREAYKVERL